MKAYINIKICNGYPLLCIINVIYYTPSYYGATAEGFQPDGMGWLNE